MLRQNADGIPNNADKGSNSSKRIARGIVENIGLPIVRGALSGQTAGRQFEERNEQLPARRLRTVLSHLRPGEWEFSLGGDISDYEQYQHLADIRRLVKEHEELRTVFEDYIVKPDIVICREPVSDSKINENKTLLSDDSVAAYTPLRRANSRAKNPPCKRIL